MDDDQAYVLAPAATDNLLAELFPLFAATNFLQV
jgi:hypothetical protein